MVAKQWANSVAMHTTHVMTVANSMKIKEAKQKWWLFVHFIKKKK